MKITDLCRIEEAPDRGYVLAYTRKKVIDHAYDKREDICRELQNEELLELHLFDADKEYRAVRSESHRFKDGFKECLADFKDSVYTAKSFLEGGNAVISTICHIAYDPDNGMAYIDNYRLSR